jgi:hypothetical protein
MKIGIPLIAFFDALSMLLISIHLAARMTSRASHHHTFAVSPIARPMSETSFPVNSFGCRTVHAAPPSASTTGGRA